MKNLLIVLFILAAGVIHAKGSDANPFSQLIGFKGGGEYFLAPQSAGWSGGVFFENVLDLFGIPYGIEIEMMKSDAPITEYAGLSITGGIGTKSYIEIGATLMKFYVQRLSFYLGISYNDFLSGSIIYNNYSNYVELRDNGENYLGAFVGGELSAQISSDLFTKVGIRFNFNPFTIFSGSLTSAGLRFYVAFGYGI